LPVRALGATRVAGLLGAAVERAEEEGLALAIAPGELLAGHPVERRIDERQRPPVNRRAIGALRAQPRERYVVVRIEAGKGVRIPRLLLHEGGGTAEHVAPVTAPPQFP